MKARMGITWGRGYRAVCLVIAFLLTSILYAAPGQVHIDSLNFVNAEISTILKSLADMSGANIVVAPDVKGVVTIKLRDVTVEQALQIVTNMSGYSYQVVNGVYMVGAKETEKTALPTNAKYVIVKLQVASPADVIAALGIAYSDVQVKSIPNNRLVISGDEKRLQAACAFIAEIDLPATENSSIDQVKMEEAMYQVKNVIPWQAKAYLDELYRDQGLTISYAPNGLGLRNITDATTQTEAKNDTKTTEKTAVAAVSQWTSDTLVLRGPTLIIKQAVESLKTIDVSQPLTEQRCSVKRIYATQAIAYLLGQYEKRGLTIVTAPMANNPTAGKESASQIGTRVTSGKEGELNVREPVGDFILIGTDDVVKDAVATLAKIDVGPERVERIYTLRFLQVGDAKTKLEELYGSDGLQVTVAPSPRGNTLELATNGASGGVADGKEDTGSSAFVRVFDLVLRGPDDVVTRAEHLLQTLDVESQQISIGSEIISIDSGASKQLGVEWPGSIGVKLTEMQSGDPLQIGRIVRDPVSLSATINLLETQNKAKLISQPSTVVQNGREALIHVGDKILYEVLSGISNGTPVYSTTQVDAGVTLKVLPQTSKDGVITLQITSNVSELVKFNQGASGAMLPQLRETSSTTVVQVRDGETLVIGGLTQNGIIMNKKSVPVLGNLPLIGGLFSSKTTTPSNRELLIMVTPRVLKPGIKPVTPTLETAETTPAN